jgi:hypothetical protein
VLAPHRCMYDAAQVANEAEPETVGVSVEAHDRFQAEVQVDIQDNDPDQDDQDRAATAKEVGVTVDVASHIYLGDSSKWLAKSFSTPKEQEPLQEQ